jgi:hypothetical protein
MVTQGYRDEQLLTPQNRHPIEKTPSETSIIVTHLYYKRRR